MRWLVAGAVVVCGCSSAADSQRHPPPPLQVSPETALVPLTEGDGDAEGTQAMARVAARSDGFLVLWAHGAVNSGYQVALVGVDGKVTERLVDFLAPGAVTAVLDETSPDYPALVANDGGYLAVYPQRTGLEAAAIAPDGTITARDVVLPSSTGATAPSASWNGQDHLVVWERRNGPIMATRLARDGTALLTTPATLSTPNVAAEWPQVMWDGGRYVVTWLSAGFYAVRLAGDGSLLDRAPFLVSPTIGAPRFGAWPVGSDVFITWQVADAGVLSHIAGVRLGADGTAGAPFSYVGDPGEYSLPALAGAGSRLLLALSFRQPTRWPDHDIAVVSLDTSVAADPASRPITDDDAEEQFPSLACGPARCLVTWLDVSESGGVVGGSEVWGAVTDLDGTRVGDPFSISRGVAEQTGPLACWNGTGYIATWAEDRSFDDGPDVFAGRLDPASAFADSIVPAVAAPNGQRPRAIACNASATLLAWLDEGATTMNTDDTLQMGVLSSSGALGPTAVLESDNRVWGAAAASDGQGFLVAWYTSLGEARAVIMPPGWDGTALQPALLGRGSLNFVGDAEGDPSAPGRGNGFTAFWTGESYVVAWLAGARVMAVRLGSDGTFLDGGAFPLAATHPSLGWLAGAAGGSHLAFAWLANAVDPMTGRLNVEGTITDLAGRQQHTFRIPIGADQGAPERLALSWDGQTFVVAGRGYVATENNMQVHAMWLARVKPDGGVVDAAPVVVVQGTGLGDSAIASSGGGRSLFIYASFDSSAGSGANRIRQRTIVSAEGAPTAGVDAGAP